MSNWIQDFIVSVASGTFATVGESKLDAILQKLHDSNETLYNIAMEAGHAFTKAVATVVEESSTHIDDAFLKALTEAIRISAEDNGVVLS